MYYNLEGFLADKMDTVTSRLPNEALLNHWHSLAFQTGFCGWGIGNEILGNDQRNNHLGNYLDNNRSSKLVCSCVGLSRYVRRCHFPGRQTPWYSRLPSILVYVQEALYQTWLCHLCRHRSWGSGMELEDPSVLPAEWDPQLTLARIPGRSTPGVSSILLPERKTNSNQLSTKSQKIASCWQSINH